MEVAEDPVEATPVEALFEPDADTEALEVATEEAVEEAEDV